LTINNLQNNSDKFEKLIDDLHVPLMIFSKNWEVLYQNKECKKIIGNEDKNILEIIMPLEEIKIEK
jgi:hypothetical protein